MMEHLFTSKGGTKLVSSFELKKSLKFDLDVMKEQSVRIAVRLGGAVDLATYHFESTNGDKSWTFTKVRDFGKFELISRQENTESFLEIRIPKAQKIMKIPDAAWDNVVGGLTGSYQTLTLLYSKEEVVTGTVTDDKSGAKAFFKLETRPGVLDAAGGIGPLKVEAVADGKILDL